MTMNGEQYAISLDLWSTAGQEQFDNIRSLAYHETDIFLVCFSVVQESSFHNIQTRWLPELQHHSPEALIVLVGLDSHLRKEQNAKSVSLQQIEDYRKQCGAVDYVETSPRKMINVNRAFETAIALGYFVHT